MSGVSVDDIRREIEKARRALAGTYVMSEDFNTIVNSLRLIKSMVEDYYASLSEDEKKLFSYTNFMNFKMYVDMLKNVKHGDFVSSSLRTNITKALISLYDFLTKTGSILEKAEEAKASAQLSYKMKAKNLWFTFKYSRERVGKGKGDLKIYAAVRSGYAVMASKNIYQNYLKVELPTGYITSSIVFGVDGDVYLTSEDGYVYQFSTFLEEKWRSYVYELHPLYSTPFIKPYERPDLNSWEYIIYASKRPIINTLTQRGETFGYLSPDIVSDYDVYSSVTECSCIYCDTTFTVAGISDYLEFLCFNLGTGEWDRRQSFQIGRSYASPMSQMGFVRVGTEDNKFYSFITFGGLYHHLVTITVGGAVRSTAFGLYYVEFCFGCNDCYIYRYGLYERYPYLEWKFLCGDAVVSSPAYDKEENHVVCGCDDCYLYCINDGGGWQKWKMYLNSRIRSSPAISASSRIYITNEDGYLYEIEKDGTLIASLYIGSNPSNIFAPSPCVV